MKSIDTINCAQEINKKMHMQNKIREETVIIKNDKIYTSYFAKAGKIIPDKRLVSIAITSPIPWNGSYYRNLNPISSELHKYKYGELSQQDFEKMYKQLILEKLNPSKVYNDLKGKVLCCWEKSGEFCHRHIVIDWLNQNLGESVIGGEI